MKPAVEVKAWQASDGSLYATREECDQRNKRLEFRERYDQYQLFPDDQQSSLPADLVFHWLETFPDLYWTFTIPPTEEETNEG